MIFSGTLRSETNARRAPSRQQRLAAGEESEGGRRRRARVEAQRAAHARATETRGRVRRSPEEDEPEVDTLRGEMFLGTGGETRGGDAGSPPCARHADVDERVAPGRPRTTTSTTTRGRHTRRRRSTCEENRETDEEDEDERRDALEPRPDRITETLDPTKAPMERTTRTRTPSRCRRVRSGAVASVSVPSRPWRRPPRTSVPPRRRLRAPPPARGGCADDAFRQTRVSMRTVMKRPARSRPPRREGKGPARDVRVAEGERRARRIRGVTRRRWRACVCAEKANFTATGRFRRATRRGSHHHVAGCRRGTLPRAPSREGTVTTRETNRETGGREHRETEGEGEVSHLYTRVRDEGKRLSLVPGLYRQKYRLSCVTTRATFSSRGPVADLGGRRQRSFALACERSGSLEHGVAHHPATTLHPRARADG